MIQSFASFQNEEAVTMTLLRISTVAAMLAASSIAAGQNLETPVLTVPDAAEQDFEGSVIGMQTVGEGLYVLRTEGATTVGNMLVSIGEDGVLLVDDQMSGILPRYREELAELGADEIDFVINTHWHYDHTGANEPLGVEGVRFISHENSRLMMARDSFINVTAQVIEQPAYGRQALPVMTFDQSMRMHFNGNRVDLVHFGSAHTAGDTAVLLPDHNLAHLGDVFNRRGFPFVDADNGGSLDGMIAFCQAVLARLRPGGTVIPGHGEVSDYATLQRYVEMLIDVRDRISAMIDEGLTLEQVIAAQPLLAWDDEFGDPTRTADRIRMIDRSYASLSR